MEEPLDWSTEAENVNLLCEQTLKTIRYGIVWHMYRFSDKSLF